MSLPRVIDTPRLRLRDLRAGDARAVFESYAGDAAVMRYVGWRRHETVQDSARQISLDVHRCLKGSAWVWGLTLQGAGDTVGPVFGQLELTPMGYPADEAHHLRLGYLMARSHWGQGLMAEAVSAVLAAVFEQPQVWRVDALCDVDNQASGALLARVGMRREGCMLRAVRHPNVSSEPRDVWVYSQVRGG
jgi:ribosomal-protein-alanine N-acetyltransferase